MPPVLLTDRLRLDGYRADDLEPLAAMWRQPQVYAAIGDGKPRSREEVWLRLLRGIGQWTLFGYGTWVARERTGDAARGAVLGELGLIEARRAIEPPLDAPEMAWMLSAEAQGRGLAREALAAILAWADHRNLTRTQCIIDPANARSIRLAEANGYVAADTRLYRDRPVALYARQVDTVAGQAT